MTRVRIIAGFLSLLLACAVAGGVFLHAAIPHQHSHDGHGTDIGWEILHESLRHEDKKTLAFIAAFLLVFAFSGVVSTVVDREARRVVRRVRYAHLTPHPYIRYVCTGVAAYRRFG